MSPVRGLALFCTLILSFPANGQSGLLLGLRGYHLEKGHEVGHRVYQTVWIRLEDHPRALGIPELLVPRRDGFWRIGGYVVCEPQLTNKIVSVDTISAFWVTPISQAPIVSLSLASCRVAYERALAFTAELEHGLKPGERLPLFVRPDISCVSEERTITYAGPKYYSFQNHTNYNCGVHPDSELRFATSVFSSSPDSQPGDVPFSAPFGEPGKRLFSRKARESSEDSVSEACATRQPDDANWGIRHVEGRWRAFGYVPTHRLCGYGNEFDLPVTLTRIGGRDSPSRTWSKVKKAYPKTIDFVTSRDGRFIVVLTAGGGFLVHSDKLAETAVARFELPENFDAVVMTESSEGAYTPQWDAAVRRIQRNGLPPPIVHAEEDCSARPQAPDLSR